MKASRGMSKQLQLKLLGTVVEFMARAGVSDKAIRDSFRNGLTKSRKLRSGPAPQYQDSRYLQNGDLSADLLRLWHRDSRFINDGDALPRPLHLGRGRNSIRALIVGLDGSANADAVVEFMKSAGLIRKIPDGRYLPTQEAGTITQNDSFVVEHLVRSVIRLFSTMRRNTSTTGKADPLIERYAYVSDLNPSDCKSFAEFTRSQGLSYLQAVDDWMEQRRISRTSAIKPKDGTGIVAGVQIVAYLGDGLGAGHGVQIGTKRKKRLKALGSARSTPSPAAPF